VSETRQGRATETPAVRNDEPGGPPLRVAMFTEAYTPVLNGVAVATRALVEGLRARGHRVDVFTPRHPRQPEDEEGVTRLPSFVTPIRGWIPLSLPLPPGAFARRIAARGPYDVVHTQHPFRLGRYARRLARLSGAPLVCTVHTQYEQYVYYYVPLLPGLGRAVMRASLRSFLTSCDGVVTVAEGMANILRGYGVPESVPIEVIPNDLEGAAAFLDADPAVAREELGVPGGEAVLLSVSRLSAEKNLPFLLESLAPLLREREEGGSTPARLVFVGDGPLRPVLERRASELGVRARVLFTGAVPHGQVAPLFAAADVFLLPSVTEVNPLTLREALAAGAPVVAVDSFSARDTIVAGGDGADGLIVPHDAAAFRAAVASLVCDPGRRRVMAAAARANARRREGEAGAGAERTLAVYRAATAGGARR